MTKLDTPMPYFRGKGAAYIEFCGDEKKIYYQGEDGELQELDPEETRKLLLSMMLSYHLSGDEFWKEHSWAKAG